MGEKGGGENTSDGKIVNRRVRGAGERARVR